MFLGTGTLSTSVLHHLNSFQHVFLAMPCHARPCHAMQASSLSNNFLAQGKDCSQEALVGDILL